MYNKYRVKGGLIIIKTKVNHWFKLDNAAKIYPVVTNNRRFNVFRMAFVLEHEVIPNLLEQAVLDCRDRFPSFYVRLRRGLFWYYYETNEKQPLVKPESPFIGDKIDVNANNGYGFTFFYYQNRISLEVFHSLTDGSGAIIFLKAVVYRYLELIGYVMQNDGTVPLALEPYDLIEIEDSYLKNYHPIKGDKIKVPNAHKIKLKRYRYGSGIILGKVKTDKLLQLAKGNHLTVTEYLVSLLTYAIILLEGDKALSPINICIPVNMRKFYQSKTFRNFSLFFHTSIKSNKNITFDEITRLIKEQFSDNITTEKMQIRLNANVAIEKNFFVRISPLFLKRIMLKTGYKLLGDKPTTATLSNLGLITLPPTMKEHVKNIEFNLVAESCPGVSVVSYANETIICFSRFTNKTELERIFFNQLSNYLEVEIDSNKWETIPKGER